MSAYIVPDQQVILIAALHQKSILGNIDLEAIKKTAQLLLNENYKSVNYRYSENVTGVIDPALITEQNIIKLINAYSPIQEIKYCENYEYQACEHDSWKRSKSKEIISDVISSQISKLDGYDSAQWGM